MTHLAFKKKGFPERKTSVWEVQSTHDDTPLGIVEWHNPWRRYAFTQNPDVIMDEVCLKEVVDFLRQEMEKRR